MRTKFLILGLLSVLCLGLILSGCTAQTHAMNEQAKDTKPVIDDTGRETGQDASDPIKAELSIDREVYSKDESMQLSLKNNDTCNISLGQPYTIEEYKDGQWSLCPLELMFTMELITLKPGETFDQTVELKDLKPGKYRISKDVNIEESETSMILYQEFEIK